VPLRQIGLGPPRMISIIVPTIKGRETVYERCVKAYKKTTPVPFELITIRDESACGIAWGLGAEQAKGDYLHFTADDLLPHAGWAEAAIECADRGVLPAATVLNPTEPLICPCPLEPKYASVPNVLVPFMSREMWEMDRWAAPIHYGSDDWITYLAVRRGIKIELSEDYMFSHSASPEGRLWMNRALDVPKLCSYMEQEGYVPKTYGDIGAEFGWVGWVG
jgi:hypothetical protein